MELKLSKQKDINKMLGRSRKHTNILLHQKSPLCKLGLWGHNHEGKFKKPLNFVKASIPLREYFTREANTSKGHTKGKKPLHVPRRGKKLRHALRKVIKPRQHVNTSHVTKTLTCHYCVNVGHTQWRCRQMVLAQKEKASGFQRKQGQREVQTHFSFLEST